MSNDVVNVCKSTTALRLAGGHENSTELKLSFCGDDALKASHHLLPRATKGPSKAKLQAQQQRRHDDTIIHNGQLSQGVMDKNESALVIIEIATKLVSPYIVLSQEYYSRIFLTPEKR